MSSHSAPDPRQAARFIFETDFRTDRGGRRASDVEVAAAREEGRQEGLAQGRQAAEREQSAALLHMAGLIAQQARELLDRHEQRLAVIEQEAASVAVMMAHALAGPALARFPLADIEAAARECLAHARGAPHLVVRVAEASVSDVEAMLARLGRETGHAGKLLVLGEPDLAPGDARLEWADGGVVVDRAGLGSAISATVRRLFGEAADPAMTTEEGA